MLATDALSAAATWRPQLFGDKRAASISDPIIEPLWTGPRILAFIDRGDVSLTDIDGDAVEIADDLRAALVVAAGASTALIEGVLAPEPLQRPEAIATRDLVTLPKPAEVATQMIVGKRGDRKDRIFRNAEEARRRQGDGIEEEAVALVAVDLVWIDDQSLCDVPLLERKRILESVIAESELVRVGMYVRPPIDPWLSAWRLFGFGRMAYKSANSRYLPGRKNQEWAQVEIPQR